MSDLPTSLRLIAAGRWRPPYGTGRAPADLEGDVLRRAADEITELRDMAAAFNQRANEADERFARAYEECGKLKDSLREIIALANQAIERNEQWLS